MCDCQDSDPACFVLLGLSLPMSAKEAWLSLHHCHTAIQRDAPSTAAESAFALQAEQNLFVPCAFFVSWLLGQVISNWLKRQTQRGLTLATELLDWKLDSWSHSWTKRNEHGFTAYPSRELRTTQALTLECFDSRNGILGYSCPRYAKAGYEKAVERADAPQPVIFINFRDVNSRQTAAWCSTRAGPLSFRLSKSWRREAWILFGVLFPGHATSGGICWPQPPGQRNASAGG